MWHELKTITHISKSRCFISVELFSIKLKTECEINRIPVLNSALCLKSREFSFSLLSFPFTDFYESFNFFRLFCEMVFLSYVFFESLRGKLARGRPKLIPSRLPDVGPLFSFHLISSHLKAQLILLSSLFQAQVFCIGNPFVWWATTLSLPVYFGLLIFYLLRRRRNVHDLSEGRFCSEF